MRQRLPVWVLACGLLIAGTFVTLQQRRRETSVNSHVPPTAANTAAPSVEHTAPPALLSRPAPVDFTETLAQAHEKQNRSRFPNRLSNTTLPLKQLAARDGAILLQNAFLDTATGVSLNIPGQLQANGDPGTYIVQAKGPPDEAFRAQLKQAGATIVSYIPNNAYLVRADASAASALEHAPQIQAVLKYEPYYKLSPLLLDLAVKQRPLPENAVLKVLLFGESKDGTIDQFKDLGATVLSEEASPFGPVIGIHPPVDTLPAIAGLSGVQAIELARKRISANDLSRFAMGVAADTQAQTNYLGLTGNGILVNVNDTGIDATHPDLPGVTGDSAISLVDSNGHGTHVAGIIASTGGKSDTVTNAQGSVMPPTNGQFRGKAPKAKLYSMDWLKNDPYLQQQAARTNAFISNNSWNYGNAAYDLAAASFDAAVRDALPTQPGSHPLLFVFSAGNLGGAMNDWDDGSNDDGTGGSADTILSPATAKNVISVGALEQPRGITNDVWKCVPNPSNTNGQSCQTNKEWMPSTDTDDQVASFSSRGNVGIGLEGPYGRFKPDVVAPGSAVVSTRSAQWNQRAYYNPTSHIGPPALVDLQLQTNALFIDSFFIPANAVAVTIDVVNRSPNVPVPIYVRQAAAPTTNTYDFVRANHVSIPPDAALSPVNAGWFYALGNPTNVPVFCDVFIDITVTNEHGNFLQVLSNMNNTIGPYYRYESGTSLAAAGVSGMLALMQEFFEQQVGVTNSPALMKALVINGARSIGSYNLQVQNSINFQGWGMVDLTNTIQGALRTQPPNALTAAKYYIDQNTNTALATGDSRTYNLRVNPDGQELTLRITLAWTDPPGNPIASMKLVNDLDLIVTNTDLPDPLTRDVFFGNDIQSGNDFNLPWDTNTAPNIDYVNNVENIYLLPPLGTNYTITVHARRVNVNALTDHPNNTVQDFALVISSGDGETNSALTLNPAVSSLVMSNPPTVLTNDFVDSPTDFGQILYVQQSGANTPLLGTNTLTTLPLGRQGQELLFDGQVTVGMTNQWHFYIFTNSPDSTFTNVAFVVYNSATLSLPRMGTWEKDPANATTIYPDIDLYVSTDPGLLRLEAGAIVGADKSLSRGGDEAVIYTNATPSRVYYIAVKSENQEAVEFTFFGDSSPLPFGSTDEQGNFHGYGHRLGAPIPDDNAKGVDILVLAFGRAMPKLTKRAVATNTVSHELMGDLLGTLNHFGTKDFVVLNNHAPDTPVVRRTFTYDDSGHVAGARRSDGPGSLLDFQGKGATGIWRLKEVDNAFGHLGTNDQFGLFLENQPDLTDGVPFQLSIGECDYAFFAVPAQATNLQLSVSLTNGTGPLLVTLCRFDAPLCASGCKSQIVYSNAIITLGLDDEPPINAGTYIVTFCNLGPDMLQGTLGPLKFELGQGLNSPRLNFTGGPMDIQDNAVTYSTIHVGNVGCMRTAEVGVRIDHPRVSDLMLHLIAPDGTRVLLNQNRGALTTNGMGYSVTSTNIIPVSSSGGPEATTNNIDTGTTSGSITISYQFFDIPDEMRVYYQGALIWNSGLIRGAGTTNLTFGPGLSSLVTIVMNQGGNTNTTTRWEYTVTSTSANYFYLTFTENTNLTSTPMKFAVPPYYQTPSASNLVNNGGFESGTNPGDSILVSTGDSNKITGWTVRTGSVDYIGTHWVPAAGGRSVDLSGHEAGVLSQTIGGFIVGGIYRLSFSMAANTEGPPATKTLRADIGSSSQTFSFVGTGHTSANMGWTNRTMDFTATSASMALTFSSLTAGLFGPALDSVSISLIRGPDYVLPEESLDKIAGLDPFGDWQLEIADTRVGATNPAPTLVKWQLSLIMENTTPAAVSLVHHQPVTNTVSPGRIRYFLVDVPNWASFATNLLLSATGPVDVIFNQINPPTGTNVGDTILIPNATSGSATLQTNGTPPLIPSQTYRLGVRNSGTLPVTFAFEVDFDVTPLTNAIPVTGVMASNSVPRYFSYDVTTNETAVLFQLTNLTGNVDLVIRDGLPFPTLGSYDYRSANVGTNDESILVVTNQEPIPLKPGRWYLGVFNADVTNNVSYTIVVTDFTNLAPSVVTLTNKAPFLRSGAPAGATDYYRYVVSTGAVRAQFELQGTNVTLLARRGALASLGAYDYSSTSGSNAPMITLFSGSGLFQLQPGEWYLSAVNASGGSVDYTIIASEFPVPGTNIVLSAGYLSKSGTNAGSFCMNWNSLGGLYYYVEGKVALTDPAWTTISGLVTGMDGQTSWCVPLPSPYRFFRIRQWLGAATASAPLPPSTPSISMGANGVTIRWSGASTNKYHVQWTTSLATPAWNSFSNTVTSGNGVFSFTDNGSQSGGLARLSQLGHSQLCKWLKIKTRAAQVCSHFPSLLSP